MSKSQKEQIKEFYMKSEDGTQYKFKELSEEMRKKHREQYGIDGADDFDEQIRKMLGIEPSGVQHEEVVFKKDDNGKLQYSLIPPLAEQEMVRVLTFGANKYSANNWKNCDNPMRYIDAALRHISAYRLGNTQDSESGLHHLAHAMCCLSFIVDMEMEIEVEF